MDAQYEALRWRSSPETDPVAASYTVSETVTAVITIGLDPTIELGPITVAWHGLTIGLGILVGGAAAGRYARERGVALDPLYAIAVILALGGIVGGRIFYLLDNDPAAVLEPGELFGTRGFSFSGGVILAAIAIAFYVRRRKLSTQYLAAVAVGLPLGVAVGRIGDVINGEHFGPATDFFLGVRKHAPRGERPRSFPRLPLGRSLRGAARQRDLRPRVAASDSTATNWRWVSAAPNGQASPCWWSRSSAQSFPPARPRAVQAASVKLTALAGLAYKL